MFLKDKMFEGGGLFCGTIEIKVNYFTKTKVKTIVTISRFDIQVLVHFLQL